jgi:phosphoglycolate phosphatase-like HAD superfamily hydrolase
MSPAVALDWRAMSVTREALYAEVWAERRPSGMVRVSAPNADSAPAATSRTSVAATTSPVSEMRWWWEPPPRTRFGANVKACKRSILRHCSVLITDLDNTLWDWFDIWYRSFNALLQEVVRISGVDQHILEEEIRAVHQARRTSEYSFLLQELPTLQRLHPGEDIVSVYGDAIHAFRRERRVASRLYPGVRETLEFVKGTGACLVGYTESMAFHTSDRIRRTGIDDILDYLYSAPDHDLPGGLTPEQFRTYPVEHYRFRRTVHRHTPVGATKPNAGLLAAIVDEVGAALSDAVYVGDSLMKDVAMAQAAGVADVWAEYGTAHAREEYELLRRVSHWTREDVEREKRLTTDHVTPTHTLGEFGNLRGFFSFGRRAEGRKS